MSAKRVCELALLGVVALLPSALRANDLASVTLPEHRADDASAAEVTALSLYENERFWPYQVTLAGALPAAEGKAAIAAGTVGVLIRVDPSGVARIDFGRDGIREVPVANTDLVARANRVRRGEDEKIAPNFVLAIGPRLLDSAADSLRPIAYEDAARSNGFLCVFADPAAPDFDVIARELAPLQDRHGVRTLLFPQGEIPDAQVRDRLRAAQWPVPFVFDHLAEPYTRSLLAMGDAIPLLMLQTREGRILRASAWKPGIAAEFAATIDASFDPKPEDAPRAGTP